MMRSDLEQHITEFTLALTADRQDGEYEIISKMSTASRIPPRLALEIYRNNTRGSRVSALESIYPACRNILGSETFRSIAREYVVADTTGTPDLNHYGETFNRHLAELVENGRLPADYAYLYTLASLEFKYHAAYYADSDPEFDFELFEHKVTSGQPVYLKPSCSLGLLASEFPVYQIWQKNLNAQESAQTGSRISDQVQSINTMQYLLVYRDTDTPMIITINDHEYRLLEAIESKLSLQSVVDRIDCDVDVLLPGFIANRWITGVDHDE